MEQNELKDFRKRKRAEDLGGGICPFQLTYNLNPSHYPPRHFPTSTIVACERQTYFRSSLLSLRETRAEKTGCSRRLQQMAQKEKEKTLRSQPPPPEVLCSLHTNPDIFETAYFFTHL